MQNLFMLTLKNPLLSILRMKVSSIPIDSLHQSEIEKTQRIMTYMFMHTLAHVFLVILEYLEPIPNVSFLWYI